MRRQDENNRHSGFPEGVAEKMLLSAFRAHQKAAEEKLAELKKDGVVTTARTISRDCDDLATQQTQLRLAGQEIGAPVEPTHQIH